GRRRRFGRGRLRFLAAAQPLRRGAQPAPDTLGLRLFGLALRVGLGLRARIELAADELDLRDLGAVALAVSDAQEARLAARPIGKPRREAVEQLRHDVAVLQILHDETPGVQRPCRAVLPRGAALRRAVGRR